MCRWRSGRLSFCVILAIPLKIISYGYLPGGRRVAARGQGGERQTVAGNPRARPGVPFRSTTAAGIWLLGKVHLWENWDAEALVVFSVVVLFLVGNGAVVAWLKRPEAWLAAFILAAQPQVSDFTQRFLLGRPFVLSIAALVTHSAGLAAARLVAAQMVDGRCWMTPLIAVGVFRARRLVSLGAADCGVFSRADNSAGAVLLAASWVSGTFLGSALTGHPVE